ncbi:MAG: hypothetical protein HY023_12885 [Chloroflexi bacterium]|nr:hypothetical protein [Chloroflexota bacterium]
MNVLNRLLILLIVLALLAVVSLAAATPAEVLGVVGTLIANLKSYADRLLPAGRVVVGLAGLAIDVGLLFWLWLEIRRPSYRTVQVRKTEGARAEVMTDTLVERLEFAVDSLADVEKAKARVRSFGKNVEVNIEAEIRPGIAVAAKAEEIAAAIREVAETTMGLALRGKPRIKIRASRFAKEAFDELVTTPPTPPAPPAETELATAPPSPSPS